MKSISTPNPEYRADWEDLHDRAAQRREAAMERLRSLWAQDLPVEDPRIVQLQNEIRETNDVCCRALLTWQHPTLEHCRDFFNRFAADPRHFHCSRMASVTAALDVIQNRREDRRIAERRTPVVIPRSDGHCEDPGKILHIERLGRHGPPQGSFTKSNDRGHAPALK